MSTNRDTTFTVTIAQHPAGRDPLNLVQLMDAIRGGLLAEGVAPDEVTITVVADREQPC